MPPAWMLSIFGFFFRLVGKEAKAEIKRRETKEAAVIKAQKKLNKLKREQQWLILFEKEQQKIKDLFKEQALNQKKREKTQAKLDSLLVSYEKNPY